MTASPEEYVVVAKITTVYGVKGWVKVHSFTDPLENFLDFDRCFYKRGECWLALDIEQSRRHGKGIVLAIDGVDDRDKAQAYCGIELAIPSADLPTLESGEFYWHQLIGLKVFSKRDELLLLGEVSDMLETGANDVMIVKPCHGSIDDQQRLVPYLPEQFIEQIDLNAGEIIVDWDPDF